MDGKIDRKGWGWGLRLMDTNYFILFVSLRSSRSLNGNKIIVTAQELHKEDSAGRAIVS